MSVSLKELRETLICLKIVIKAEIVGSEKLEPLAEEVNELIAIFVTSIKTARQNIKTENNSE